MNLERKLTLSTCLMVLAVILVPILGASIETQSESPTDRVKRRSFYNPYSVTANRRNSVSIYEASSVFKPSPYTVPRPYYIPVYGTQGRQPLIFYPPQPIYVNPGIPQDNPLVPPSGGLIGYLPPNQSPHFTGGDQYLPPKESAATTTPKTLVQMRFGEEDEVVGQDDPNAPDWGDGNGGVVPMQLSGDQDVQSGPIPTRPPMSRPTQPPLVHVVSSSQSSSGSASTQQTLRPPPPPTLRTTTVSPLGSSGPSNCIWAIISCCSASSPTVFNQNCFEKRGCPGPFWGASPCESTFAKSAIAAAVDYYNRNPNSVAGK